MVDNNCIIEGTVKFRDGKKWKSRWCVMRKLSPVAGNVFNFRVVDTIGEVLVDPSSAQRESLESAHGKQALGTPLPKVASLTLDYLIYSPIAIKTKPLTSGIGHFLSCSC
ncbi:hypothetical protein TcasGA2_TC034080 [Tribolium castaneum]|uniref:Uncharacterized protein n=1 Tax=Tribolium castaneum TaxID=7070 RepID=A0A139WD69_TRICA|nr:hypothetical protein TcasGA2_TC034080 [Tribolium castaneum]